MTGTTGDARSSIWARLLEIGLPDGAAEGQLLFVGPDSPEDTDVVYWDPAAEAPRPEGSFDFVACAGAIQADRHPANLLLAIWEVMPVGGTLLLHSRVLTDPDSSMYARFVATALGAGATEWLPGRLALRWTVETNGFDVVRWLRSGSSEPEGEDDAYLAAVRTGRTPALTLATPLPIDGPGQRPEGS